MPHTKRPRAASSTTSTASSSTKDLEETQQYESGLEDFDKKLEAHLTNVEKATEAFMKELDMMWKMCALGISREDRQKPFDLEFSAGGGVALAPAPAGDGVARALEEVSQKISEEVDAVKKSIRSTRKKRKAAPGSASVTRSARKTPAQQQRQRKSTLPPPTTGTLRRSTRKRTTRNLDMETPSASSYSSLRGRPLSTPAITPKFDITTPMSRTVMRLARPDETLVSLSGSPVYAGQTTSTAKRGGKRKKVETPELVAIPLGKGRTVMLPLGDLAGTAPTAAAAAASTAKKSRRGGAGAGRAKNGGSSASSSSSQLDLDEEDRLKLLSIQSKIGDMLESVQLQ